TTRAGVFATSSVVPGSALLSTTSTSSTSPVSKKPSMTPLIEWRSAYVMSTTETVLPFHMRRRSLRLRPAWWRRDDRLRLVGDQAGRLRALRKGGHRAGRGARLRGDRRGGDGPDLALVQRPAGTLRRLRRRDRRAEHCLVGGIGDALLVRQSLRGARRRRPARLLVGLERGAPLRTGRRGGHGRRLPARAAAMDGRERPLRRGAEPLSRLRPGLLPPGSGGRPKGRHGRP